MTGRPIPDVRNHTIWVDEDIIFAFSTKIIAYPEPRYALLFENGLQPNGIRDSMTMNTVNNFTLYFYKTTVQQTDYGTYNLHINNTFGETTVYIDVLSQSECISYYFSSACIEYELSDLRMLSKFYTQTYELFS